MGRIGRNYTGFDRVGEDAAEEADCAGRRTSATGHIALPRNLLVLIDTAVFPAMMSLSALLGLRLIQSQNASAVTSATLDGKLAASLS